LSTDEIRAKRQQVTANVLLIRHRVTANILPIFQPEPLSGI
jgi:hypothetical protein